MITTVQRWYHYLCATVIFFLASCRPSLYQAIDANSYVQTAKQADKKKYILIKDSWIVGYKADALATLVNKKRWKVLQKALVSVKDPQVHTFFQAIKDIKRKNYQQAYQSLSTLPKDGFDCQVELLRADCMYEMKERQGAFHTHYQKTYDCTTDNTIKEIITRRYRFTKYGY
ncbi:MAG: hypothetical protein AAF944_29010 [Bacteroidota bacterium]